VEVDGKRISGKRLVARLLWQIATTGQATLVGGTVINAGPQGWLDVVKFLYAQIDGAPPHDVNLGGQEDNPLFPEVVDARKWFMDLCMGQLAARGAEESTGSDATDISGGAAT